MASGKDVLPQLSGDPSALLVLAQDFMQISEKANGTLLASQGLGAFDAVQTWGEATAPARIAEATELQGHVTEAGTVYAAAHKAISDVQQQLVDSKRSITLAQADWDEAEDTYWRRIRTINRDAAEMALTQEEVDALAAKAQEQREGEQQKATSSWRDAAELAGASASAAATSILAALSAFVPAASRGNPHDIALHLTRNMPLSQDVERDQYARSQAEKASQLLDRYAKGDEAALAEFTAAYGDLSPTDRSYFELALADKLGPAGFHRLVNSLYIDGATRYLNGSDYPDDVTAAMDILAGAFVTKGGDPSALNLLGEHTLARAQNQQGAWFAELSRLGPESIEIPEALGDDGLGFGNSNGFWMQAQLLGRAATWGRNPGDEYFDVVGKALLEYDAGINSLSHPLSRYHMGLTTMPPIWSDNPGNEEYAFGDDPMYHVLRSARLREGSTHAFLLNEFGYRSSEGSTATTGVLDYLVGARDSNAYLHTDQGLIARMVEEHGSGRSPEDRADVELASRYLGAVVDTLDRGEYLGLRGETLQIPGGTFGTARVPLANLMASHIDAFIYASSENAALDSSGICELTERGEVVAYQVGFTQEQIEKLDALYGEIARDRPEQLSYHGAEGHNPGNPPALERVMAAALAYNRHQIEADLLSGVQPSLTGVGIARNVEFINNVINSSEAALTDEADKNHVRGFASAVAKAGAGKVPVATLAGSAIAGPAGTGVGFIADQAWKYTAGAMIDEWATELIQEPVDTTKADHAQLRKLFDETYRRQAIEAVLSTNKWPTDQTPTAFLQQEYKGFPTDSFVNQDGTINTSRIDPDSPEYSNKAYLDFQKFRRSGYLEAAVAPYLDAIRAGIVEGQR